MILQACEDAATAAGFRKLEMGATLSGVAFYKAKGYVEVENQQVPLEQRRNAAHREDDERNRHD